MTYCWASPALPARKKSPIQVAFMTISETSLNADRHFVARATEVIQTHCDSRSRRKTAGNADVDLVVAGITGSGTEIKDLGESATDGHLRRDHAVCQAKGVHGQSFSSERWVTRRCSFPGRSVPDRALPSQDSAACGVRRGHAARRREGARSRIVEFRTGYGKAG